MRRTAIAAVLVCASLLVVSIASPAFGGPSIGSVAKTAKRALVTGKGAKRSAASAKKVANAARSLAGTANGKADQALARPAVTPGGITTVTNVAPIPASSFNAIAATCPAGQRAISGGVTSVTNAGGVWTDHASADRTAWVGGGEDLGASGGTLTVYAYCAPAGTATIARKGAVADEVAALLASKGAAQK